MTQTRFNDQHNEHMYAFFAAQHDAHVVALDDARLEDAMADEANANIFTYIDGNGIQHESYEAACHYYGADTPDQIEAEMRDLYAEEWIASQDAMEARGGPVFVIMYALDPREDDVPF